ncbi:MAG: zinc ribbon domain-containing protein [Nitrospirae bacterium]|nr:zinc ribbon domain-containing protein [Nitrospirota bacterium]
MPIYEYRCKSCQYSFEALVRAWSDSEETDCPICGSKETERLLSTFSSKGDVCAPSGGGWGGG